MKPLVFASVLLTFTMNNFARGQHSAFGEQVAGTFYGTGVFEGFPAIADILTFNADGTFTGTANDDFGFGDIATNGFGSPEHGSWEQLGEREIGTSSLGYGYDANGLLENVFRIDSRATFTEDFGTIAGAFSVHVFLPDQNPLRDTPVASLDGGTYRLERSGPQQAPNEFGRQVAGTFYGTGALEGFPPIADILTFHADGTFTGTANDDFGFGDIATNGFGSPEHGSWEQLGEREIGTSSLGYGYDANGLLENVFRIDSRATFTEDFGTIAGAFSVHVFLPDQNPLRDTPVASLDGGTYRLERSGPQQAPNEFGRQVAGTFYGTGALEGFPPIADILTFHADGTFTGTANDDFGFGDIATNGFGSPEHGSWKQVGAREIETSSLGYGYDANGLMENVFRIESRAAFSEDFGTLTGAFTVHVFLPDQNPLSDIPAASIDGGTYSVQRLRVIPEPAMFVPVLTGLVSALLIMARRR